MVNERTSTEQSNDRGGGEWSKYIPHCTGGVTKRASLGGGIEYPVSGWTSLPHTKLIPAGVSKNISPGEALLMAPPQTTGTAWLSTMNLSLCRVVEDHFINADNAVPKHLGVES